MQWSKLTSVLEAMSGAPFCLRNVRLPSCVVDGPQLPVAGDGLVSADLVLEGGRIGQLCAPASRADLPDGPDLGQAICWPRPVDCHTHLDKGLVWHRTPNPDGRFESAGPSARADAATYHGQRDIRQRAEFALRTAFAHGTAAIRTHVDAARDTFDVAFDVLSELADDWRDRVTLQICPFTGHAEDEGFLQQIARRAAEPNAGVLSVFLQSSPDLDTRLDQIVSLARTHDLSLDFHADENLDPESHCLEAIALSVLRTGFERPVLVGHCCALGVQPDHRRERTLELAAEAGLGIVALPLCNAYLMDRRASGTPRHRGFAPVHEIRRAGIPVALASDNVRDPYYAYGNYDMADLFRDAVRMMHLDHPVGNWPATVMSTAADLMTLPDAGRIAAGSRADLILFNARTWSEFVCRPQSDRIVLHRGRTIDTTPPDMRELDQLEGMRA